MVGVVGSSPIAPTKHRKQNQSLQQKCPPKKRVFLFVRYEKCVKTVRGKRHSNHRRGATPAPCKGARLLKGLTLSHRDETAKACKRLGRAIWEHCSGYHRSSPVEMKMNCFNHLSQKLMAECLSSGGELSIRAFWGDPWCYTFASRETPAVRDAFEAALKRCLIASVQLRADSSSA